MAKFNINTFDPIYPASNDKSGEIQLIQIRDSSDVSASWSPEVRIDLLPILQDNGDDGVRTTPWGRQTMFRQVVSENLNLYWSDDVTSESFMTDGAGTTSNISFLNFLKENTNKYENFINGTLSDLGEAVSIRITKVHVIGSNVQFIEKGNDHIFFHTYDVIFYGQESPNPYVEPEPEPAPCIPYNYVQSVVYNQNPLKVTPTVDLLGSMFATLISVDPSKGTQAVTWQYRGFAAGNPYVAGEQYAIKVNADPTPTGTTIALSLFMGSFASSPYGITIILTDAGITDQYFAITCNPSTPTGTNTSSLRINASAQTPQTPTSGGNFNVSMSFQFAPVTCIPT